MSRINVRIDLDENSTFKFLVRTEADDSGVVAAVVAEGDMGKLGLGFRSVKQIKQFREALAVAESVILQTAEDVGMVEEDDALDLLTPPKVGPDMYQRLDEHGGVVLSPDTRTLPRRHTEAASILHERRAKDRRGAHVEDEGETGGD